MAKYYQIDPELAKILGIDPATKVADDHTTFAGSNHISLVAESGEVKVLVVPPSADGSPSVDVPEKFRARKYHAAVKPAPASDVSVSAAKAEADAKAKADADAAQAAAEAALADRVDKFLRGNSEISTLLQQLIDKIAHVVS